MTRNILRINRARFEAAVRTMSLPQERKLGTPGNARWFLRNGITQSNHHKFHRAVDAALKLAQFH